MDNLPIKLISPFPIVFLSDQVIPTNGGIVCLSSYCSRKYTSSTTCRDHYKKITDGPDGIYQCPFGFSSVKFDVSGRQYAVTGVVPYPRLGGSNETIRAKDHPENKVSQENINKAISFFRKVNDVLQDEFDEQLKKYPVAFHELRKLNGAIKQRAEILIGNYGENEDTLTIYSSAELMSNNFDLLELLASNEDLTSLPLNSTINLWDLSYKCKKIYQPRARDKKLDIWVEGDKPIIYGNKKTFPSLLTVLVENAIKYSEENTKIYIDIRIKERTATLSVVNISKRDINTERCFEKGFRSDCDTDGSGLGLYVAQLVATQHNSKIVCYQSGTRKTFSLILPLHDIVSQ